MYGIIVKPKHRLKNGCESRYQWADTLNNAKELPKVRCEFDAAPLTRFFQLSNSP